MFLIVRVYALHGCIDAGVSVLAVGFVLVSLLGAHGLLARAFRGVLVVVEVWCVGFGRRTQGEGTLMGSRLV